MGAEAEKFSGRPPSECRVKTGQPRNPGAARRGHGSQASNLNLPVTVLVRDSVQREHLDRPDVNTWIGRG